MTSLEVRRLRDALRAIAEYRVPEEVELTADSQAWAFHVFQNIARRALEETA